MKWIKLNFVVKIFNILKKKISGNYSNTGRPRLKLFVGMVEKFHRTLLFKLGFFTINLILHNVSSAKRPIAAKISVFVIHIFVLLAIL